MAVIGAVLASTAGIFAALAAFFSKFAFDSDSSLIYDLDRIVRLLCIVMVILCNVIMWITFMKSLHASPSVAFAMIFNTTANYVITGAFSILVFGEYLKYTWYLGIVCMLVGVAFIRYGAINDTKKGE